MGKLTTALALVAFGAQPVLSQNPSNPPPQQVFCGSQACLIDTPISCETLVAEYTFQGSCCSLQPIQGISGCRVEVKAGGNCFWLPDCGLCDAAHPSQCNKIYRSANTEACPASDFDPFNSTKVTCPPTSDGTLAPTPAPVPALTPAPIPMEAEPTTSPNQPPPSIVFCGPQPCLIDTPISCETLVAEYTFQGSCCSLSTIGFSGGCRIEVGGGGNCFWSPVCGTCRAGDPSECNQRFETISTDACPASDFDPFNSTKVTCPPTTATTTTVAPTPGPTPAPTQAPPTTTPSTDSSSVSSLLDGGLFVSSFLLGMILSVLYLLESIS